MSEDPFQKFKKNRGKEDSPFVEKRKDEPPKPVSDYFKSPPKEKDPNKVSDYFKKADFPGAESDDPAPQAEPIKEPPKPAGKKIIKFDASPEPEAPKKAAVATPPPAPAEAAPTSGGPSGSDQQAAFNREVINRMMRLEALLKVLMERGVVSPAELKAAFKDIKNEA